MTVLSKNTYGGDGVTTDFSVTFPYINRTHVKVYLNGNLQVSGLDYSWQNDTTIRFSTAPLAGAVVLLDRDTPTGAKVVDFENSSVLTSQNLDDAFDQLLFIAQENQDASTVVIDYGTNIDLVANNISSVNTDAANISSIVAVANSIANINKVAEDLPTLNGYAPLDSPDFTNGITVAGNSTFQDAVTFQDPITLSTAPALTDDSDKIPTTAWVRDVATTTIINSGDKVIGSPEGLTLARNGLNPNTRLDIDTGRAVVAVGSDRLTAISTTPVTKRLDQAWAAGSGNGGRFSGTVSTNQTWHVFIMVNDSTLAVDFGFSTSVTGSDKPAGWSVRRIGSWLTDGSGNLRNIQQVGNKFIHDASILSYSGDISSTATLYSLEVPTGLNVVAEVALHPGDTAGASASCGLLMSSPLASDETPSSFNFTTGANWDAGVYVAGYASYSCPYKQVLTNTDAKIRIRSAAGSAWNTNKPALRTLGWIDTRS